MRNSALVLGGAGFIGSNFVDHLLAHSTLSLVVADKLTYAGHLENLEPALRSDRATFKRLDICDGAEVEKTFAEHQPRWVINFAAESHVDRSIDGPRAFIATNVAGTLELLEAARAYHSALSPAEQSVFRFLHVSTDEVYGSLGPTGAFTELSPYQPNSPYAASKAGADHLVRAYQETFGLPTLLTNCSNNYGPRQFPEKLIPLTILNAIEGRALPIYGTGANIRDWLHVQDHCQAIHVVLNQAPVGRRYNIGGDSERTNLQIVDAICEILEELRPSAANRLLPVGTSYRSLKTFVPDRPGHDQRYAIDPSLLRRELKWRPAFTLNEGLKATVRWYLENREWCAAVQRTGSARDRRGLGEPATSSGGRT